MQNIYFYWKSKTIEHYLVLNASFLDNINFYSGLKDY